MVLNMAHERRFWSSAKGEGEGMRFLFANVDYDGDDCLSWPLGRDDHGYGMVGFMGKQQRASRAMCELVNGAPPGPEYEAAHSCGKGHEGCVHPRHLSWKTPAQNRRDAVRHGRYKAGALTLTPADVDQIRLLRGKASQAAIGLMFGVTGETIGKIYRGETWRPGAQVRHKRARPSMTECNK